MLTINMNFVNNMHNVFGISERAFGKRLEPYANKQNYYIDDVHMIFLRQ